MNNPLQAAALLGVSRRYFLRTATLASGAILARSGIVPAASPAARTRLQKPEPRPGEARVSPSDAAEMLYIPAGWFLQGSRGEDRDADEPPQGRVYLAGFWIGNTEVAN